MPFPFSIRRTILVPVGAAGDDAVERALVGIRNGLDRNDAERVQRWPTAVEFAGPPSMQLVRRRWPPPLLQPIGRGRIEVDRAGSGLRVRYELSLRRMLAIHIGVVAFFGAVIWNTARDWIPLAFLTGVVTLTFVVQFVSSAIRFPRFLRAAVRETDAAQTGS
jgi:hypothetical protein